MLLSALDGKLVFRASHYETTSGLSSSLLTSMSTPINNLVSVIDAVRTENLRGTNAANAAGRLSGKELLKFANDETTIAQLKDRIAKTIEYLKSVKQNEVDGTEGKEIKITFPNGNVRDFTGQSLLLGNALPNFYFHATTAYAILRENGFSIGKQDFLKGVFDA